MAVTPRVFAEMPAFLEFAGANVGHLQDATGGTCYGELVTDPSGPDRFSRKHLGGIKFDDIDISFGPNMDKRFFQWIEKSVKGQYERQNGALINADFSHKEISRLTFQHALLRELTIPALDASSKEPLYFDLKMTPAETKRDIKNSGKTLPQLTPAKARMVGANFKLDIPTLDCTRVTKVDAITFKQKVARDLVGEQRDFHIEASRLEYSNLAITVAESHADSFYKWFEDFVIKGNNGQDMEKNGKLEFLSQDLKKVLFTVNLNHLGIFKIEPAKVPVGGEAMRRAKVEMYLENIEVKFAEMQ
jgi:hypothetical protein